MLNMSTSRHAISSSARMLRLIASRNVFFLSTATFVFLFYYSIVLMFSHSLLGDPDTLWHIRTGQWILDHAQVPTVDFYSYTATGKRWISTEWLSEIFYAIAYRIGEWRGVVILSSLSCATIVAILCFYLVRHLRFSIAIGWTALTALAISLHFSARPHLFGYALMAIWLIKLVDSYDREDFNSSASVLMRGNDSLGKFAWQLYVWACIALCFCRLFLYRETRTTKVSSMSENIVRRDCHYFLCSSKSVWHLLRSSNI